MAGGQFTVQNKIRPGVYIHFNSQSRPAGTAGERGIVTMALPLGWGESKKVVQIEAGDDLISTLGYDITAPEMLLIREALKRARTLLFYRLNTGVKATAAVADLTVNAKHGGVRGNDISIRIQKNLDDITKYEVMTFVEGEEVDKQLSADISELKDNEWVSFSGTGSLEETAALPLQGGENNAVTNQDHIDYLAAIEVHDFQTMALVSEDSTLKALYTSFVKRLRNDEGRKIQAVMENYPAADCEGVVSVKNGVILSDGTILEAKQATAWVAGAMAGVEINQSLTHQAYDSAVDVDTRYTHSQIENALVNGEFVFIQNNGRAIVEQDINTLTAFTPNEGKVFSKNRVIRLLDSMNNDFKRIFESFYIGKVDNNDDGRNLLRNECNTYLESLQNRNAVQNFNPQTDVRVEQGDDPDSVYVEIFVQPVDSVEKIYMKVQVR